MSTKKSHFENLSVIEHLKNARQKGSRATSDLHAVEAPGHISAGADSAKDVAISTLLIQMIASTLDIGQEKIFILLSVYLVGIFFWKVGRSAQLGWARIERINKAVMEEKFEIENNREEEREELTEIYAAKGLREPLLSKIIDVLMADDNKLLSIMLEEELGIPMESYVHPLKQALGAGVGVVIAALSIPTGLAISPSFGLFITAFSITGITGIILAKMEKLEVLEYTIKSLSITFLATFATYFFTKFLVNELL